MKSNTPDSIPAHHPTYTAVPDGLAPHHVVYTADGLAISYQTSNEYETSWELVNGYLLRHIRYHDQSLLNAWRNIDNTWVNLWQVEHRPAASQQEVAVLSILTLPNFVPWRPLLNNSPLYRSLVLYQAVLDNTFAYYCRITLPWDNVTPLTRVVPIHKFDIFQRNMDNYMEQLATERGVLLKHAAGVLHRFPSMTQKDGLNMERLAKDTAAAYRIEPLPQHLRPSKCSIKCR